MIEQTTGGCPFAGKTESLTRRADLLTPGLDITARGTLMQAQNYDDSRTILKDTAADQAGFLAGHAGNAQGRVITTFARKHPLRRNMAYQKRFRHYNF